jgi:Transposase (partial DDE domain)
MKGQRCEAAIENWKLLQSNWDLFMRCIIKGDETWIHHCDPETKQQSIRWKLEPSPSPRESKVQASAVKIMCTVFLDAEGMCYWFIICCTTNEYRDLLYTDLFCKLRVKILKKNVENGYPCRLCVCMTHCMHLLTGRMLDSLLYWNACRFEEMRHLPYYPNMAPSDNHPFPNLWKHLRGWRFSTDELTYATEECLRGQSKLTCSNIYRWRKTPRSLRTVHWQGFWLRCKINMRSSIF